MVSHGSAATGRATSSVVVTGATGRIGREVVQSLFRTGRPVVNPARREAKGARRVTGRLPPSESRGARAPWTSSKAIPPDPGATRRTMSGSVFESGRTA